MIPHADRSIWIGRVRGIDTLGADFEDSIAAVPFVPKAQILRHLHGEHELSLYIWSQRLTWDMSNGFCVTIFGHSPENDPLTAVRRRRREIVEKNMSNDMKISSTSEIFICFIAKGKDLSKRDRYASIQP